MSFEETWFDSRLRQDIFLFSIACRPAVGPTQSPILWLSGTVSPQVKQQCCEAEYWHACSTEVKNSWSYTFTPSYVFMACTGTTLLYFTRNIGGECFLPARECSSIFWVRCSKAHLQVYGKLPWEQLLHRSKYDSLYTIMALIRFTFQERRTFYQDINFMNGCLQVLTFCSPTVLNLRVILQAKSSATLWRSNIHVKEYNVILSRGFRKK
jgi:hypothetical protein